MDNQCIVCMYHITIMRLINMLMIICPSLMKIQACLFDSLAFVSCCFFCLLISSSLVCSGLALKYTVEVVPLCMYIVWFVIV